MLELCRCPNIYGPDCIFFMNVGNQTVAGSIDFYSIFLVVNGYQQLFDYQNSSSFVFNRRKKLMQVCNNFWVNYYLILLKSGSCIC